MPRNKAHTARAIVGQEFNVEYPYTVEASAFGFGPSRNKNTFTGEEYRASGAHIANALNSFTKVVRGVNRKSCNRDDIEFCNDPRGRMKSHGDEL